MHVILAGNGTHLLLLCRICMAQGVTVTVVNNQHDECLEIARHPEITVFEGEYVFPGLLEEAGAHHADVLVALAPADHENLTIGQVAQTRFQVPRVLAIVHDPENEQVFASCGIKSVVPVRNLIDQLFAKPEENTE